MQHLGLVATVNVSVRKIFVTETLAMSLRSHTAKITSITPQPLYNTIAGVQANFGVSYPIRVII